MLSLFNNSISFILLFFGGLLKRLILLKQKHQAKIQIKKNQNL